jgi:hypothetical protein
MRRTTDDVERFLAGLEGKQGDDIRLLDAVISERMRGHDRHLYEGKFWGGTDQHIIGYGILDYDNRSGARVEWFIVGVAAQKHHLSIYVNAVKDGAYLLRDYEKRLGRAKFGSASISFESIDDLDLDSLTDLFDEAARSG